MKCWHHRAASATAPLGPTRPRQVALRAVPDSARVAESHVIQGKRATNVAAQPMPYSYLLPRQAAALFAAGAVLGPLCDGLHSQHNVLHYEHPTVMLKLEGLHWSFETCWWVPLLFGAAGLILGVSVPILDYVATREQQRQQRQQQPILAKPAGLTTASSPKVGLQDPSWCGVLLCISFFVTQYWLSGVLEDSLHDSTLGSSPVPALDALLCGYALLHWWVFDATLPGFAMSALTAVCGPAVEVALINLLGLYHYAHPVWFGAVPTWIPWVYFCGGPAVGNLGRIVWQRLAQEYRFKHSNQGLVESL